MFETPPARPIAPRRDCVLCVYRTYPRPDGRRPGVNQTLPIECERTFSNLPPHLPYPLLVIPPSSTEHDKMSTGYSTRYCSCSIALLGLSTAIVKGWMTLGTLSFRVSSDAAILKFTRTNQGLEWFWKSMFEIVICYMLYEIVRCISFASSSYHFRYCIGSERVIEPVFLGS